MKPNFKKRNLKIFNLIYKEKNYNGVFNYFSFYRLGTKENWLDCFYQFYKKYNKKINEADIIESKFIANCWGEKNSEYSKLESLLDENDLKTIDFLIEYYNFINKEEA